MTETNNLVVIETWRNGVIVYKRPYDDEGVHGFDALVVDNARKLEFSVFVKYPNEYAEKYRKKLIDVFNLSEQDIVERKKQQKLGRKFF